MLSTSRIRIAPPEEPEPHRGHTPIARAHCWRSPFEENDETSSTAIFMTQRAYVRCCVHAGSDMNNEVGGGLVGKRRVDSATGQPFIVIEAAIPARHVRHGSSYLTFTQDSLVALHDDLEERYPNKELLGWFHTHPRMGIFLSGYDVWLHEHFFPNPWQVALVIEPHTSIGGFFVRDDEGQLDPRRYTGFYELAKQGRASVMRWGNLHLAAPPLPAKGETP
jgi:proteasome lid subunit RPN8/RPN11